MNVETEIIPSIMTSLKGRAVIFVIVSDFPKLAGHDWLFVYILANDMTPFIQPLTYSTRSSKQQNSRHTL
jgi:hypothetical protein